MTVISYKYLIMETFIQDALPKDGNYVPDGKMALPHRRTSKI
jgi:hypothetical protein